MRRSTNKLSIDMTRAEIENALAETVERLRANGDSWWLGSEMAPIAYRRLSSFTRRSKSKNPSQK